MRAGPEGSTQARFVGPGETEPGSRSRSAGRRGRLVRSLCERYSGCGGLGRRSSSLARSPSSWAARASRWPRAESTTPGARYWGAVSILGSGIGGGRGKLRVHRLELDGEIVDEGLLREQLRRKIVGGGGCGRDRALRRAALRTLRDRRSAALRHGCPGAERLQVLVGDDKRPGGAGIRLLEPDPGGGRRERPRTAVGVGSGGVCCWGSSPAAVIAPAKTSRAAGNRPSTERDRSVRVMAIPPPLVHRFLTCQF